jgi:hypothetical protein
VLIATQQTEFKEEVVFKVVEGFETDQCFIEIIDLRDLSGKSTENYKAIVIMNEYQFWMIDRHVREFLKNLHNHEKRKIILLSTTDHPSLMPKESDVDAISSASEIETADAISEAIIERVQTLLQSN